MAWGQGYRLIGGRVYYLNGSVSGHTVQELQENMRREKVRKLALGFLVRFIYSSECIRNVYEHKLHEDELNLIVRAEKEKS